MKVLRGIPASGGVVIGPGYFLARALPSSVRSTVPREKAEEEVAAFLRAMQRSKDQIRAIRDGVRDQSSEHYQILSVHLALLEDSMLVDQTVRLIRENRYKADYAFSRVLQGLLETFHRIEDQYLRERGNDLRQIGHRVLENLAGRPVDAIATIRAPAVIVRSPVLGFATDVGSKTSHTAIVARSLGIPAVVGLERITEEYGEEEEIVIDGEAGIVVLNPTPDVVREYAERKKAYAVRVRDLAKFAKLPAVTQDGKRLNLLGN